MGLYLGLMSGASVDAIDAALVDFDVTPLSIVATTAALGLDPDYVEAIAFAWFDRRTLAGLPSSAGSETGAEGARILGGVYRHA